MTYAGLRRATKKSPALSCPVSLRAGAQADPYSGPHPRCWAARRIALRDRLTDGVAIKAISTALRRSWFEANYRRMVRLTFALLPSPLLGPEACGPVADVLRSGGWSVLEQAGAAEPPNARAAC
jgi:hypothetical protein